VVAARRIHSSITGHGARWVLMGSMLADTVDWDEGAHGRAAGRAPPGDRAVDEETGTTVALFLSGQILLWSGYDVAHGVAQSEAAAVAALPVSARATASVVAASALLCFYPITEEKARAMRGKSRPGGNSQSAQKMWGSRYGSGPVSKPVRPGERRYRQERLHHAR